MTTRIPLHGKGKPEDVVDLHMAMSRINPQGFRQAPTSPKNPAFHSPKPATRLERLSRKVYGT